MGYIYQSEDMSHMVVSTRIQFEFSFPLKLRITVPSKFVFIKIQSIVNVYRIEDPQTLYLTR